MSDHVAVTSQRELGPVNTTLILTTSICTGGLTVFSELLGKAVDSYALYILVVVWLLAILLYVALIGRESQSSNVTTGNWLLRWSACIRFGAGRVKEKWAYSLLLFAMATLGGTTSYLNFKRAHSQNPIMQGRPAADEDIWMALTQGNAKVIEHEKHRVEKISNTQTCIWEMPWKG